MSPSDSCELGLEGMRVLVTSSTRGLGLGAARVLARCGARVFITGRSPVGVEEALRRVPGACGAPVDLAVEGSAGELVRLAVECLGGLDGLVYIPPPPPGGGVLDTPTDAWRLSFRLLIEAAIEAVREAVQAMENGGSIVFVTSIAAWEPVPSLATSSVLRPGLHSLTILLARELAPRGIRVNAVVPGYFETERLREALRLSAEKWGSSIEEERRRLLEEIPLGRFGRPEELGWAVAFLLSPLSSYITGAVLAATGGLHRAPH